MALSFDIFGWNRILKPKQVKRFERAWASFMASLTLNFQRASLRADSAIERFEPLATGMGMGIVTDVDGVGVGRVEVEFDGGKAFADDLARFFGVVGRVGRFAGVAIGVDADLSRKRPPKNVEIGVLTVRPSKSHRAISMPLMAIRRSRQTQRDIADHDDDE